MTANDTASAAQRAHEALAEIFYGEISRLAASDRADMASVEDAAIAAGHAAMAAALGAALERLDLALAASLPEGCRVKDRRPRTLATKVGDVTFRATRVRGPLGCSYAPLLDALDLPHGARISPAACGFLVEAGCDVSYARAARLLAKAGWQVLWALWDGGEEAAASLLEASAELGLARPARTARVLGYLRNNMELIAGDGPSMGAMESENQHVYGVRMDSFPCAWSVRGASDMARLRSRSVSGRAIPRMTREKSMSPKRRAARERREIAALARGSAANVPTSSGSGYEPPHRASLVGAKADVRYTAGIDRGMVAIRG